MRVEINKHSIICHREPQDPKFYGVKNAKGESNLLHYIKTHLNNLIKNNQFIINDGKIKIYIPNIPLFIKKRMWKDGNMVDDMQQYLRSAKPFFHNETQKNYELALWNTHWAINGLEKDWNAGDCRLTMEWLE